MAGVRETADIVRTTKRPISHGTFEFEFPCVGGALRVPQSGILQKTLVWKLNQPSLQSRKPSVSIAPDGFFMGDHFGRNFLQRTIERTKCSPTKEVQQTIQITTLVFPLGLKFTGGEGLHGESSRVFYMFHMFFCLDVFLLIRPALYDHISTS